MAQTVQWFAVDALRNDESDSFRTYAEAVEYANTLADEWEANHPDQIADRSWGSQDNLYCVKCGEQGFIAVVIAVVKDEF